MVELELLGVVWALEKCSLYLLGMRNFKVVTDHKPLLSILNNNTTNEIQTPRLQRLKEKTIRFGNFEAIWRSGKQNILADTLSRAPILGTESETDIENDGELS